MNNVSRSWKTSVLGAIMLALAGFGIYSNPASASDPQVLGTIVGGVGLLFAKDGDKTGTAMNPPATPVPPAPPEPKG